MKGGLKSSQGFTIIEVMIVLAVSGAIFASAMIAMSGKLDRTEFSTALYDFTSQLQTIITNVSSGYYNTSSNYTCIVNPSPLSVKITSGTPKLGQNFGCTYIGEVLQFTHINSASDGYYVYPVVGLQYKNGQSPTEVTDLNQTKPTALYNDGVRSTVNASQKVILPYGITVHSLTYSDNTTPSCGATSGTIASFGFFTTFNGYSGSSSNLGSGSQSIQLVPIPGSTIGDYQPAAVGLIDSLHEDINNCVTSPPGLNQIITNPSQGITLCVDSGTTNESSKIVIGGSNNPGGLTATRYSNHGCV
jgi:prepilin-type N-terminal cleavage/methylation domain-containing protein